MVVVNRSKCSVSQSIQYESDFVTLFPWWLNRILVTLELPGLLKQMICWEWPHSNILTLPSWAPVRSEKQNKMWHQFGSFSSASRWAFWSQHVVLAFLCSQNHLFYNGWRKQFISHTLEQPFWQPGGNYSTQIPHNWIPNLQFDWKTQGCNK